MAIAGIILEKSDNLTVVLDSLFLSKRCSALLRRFSKAEILSLALTPLFSSIYSLCLASKLISSSKSAAKEGR